MNRKQTRADEKKRDELAKRQVPKVVGEPFATALRHHRAGDLIKAERLYRQVLSFDPRHSDSLHLLGVIAYQTEHHDLAASLIREAIAINASTASYHSNLGLVLNRLARPGEALACYRKALDLDPKFPDAYNNLGLMLQDLEQLDEAAACYRSALNLNPDFAQVHSNLGNLLEKQGFLEAAASSLRKAVDLKPDYAEAYNNLGVVLRRQGYPNEAIACYTRALDLQPNFSGACDNMGVALKDLGRFEEAVAAHEKALGSGSDPCVSYYGLSGCRKFTKADKSRITEMESLLEGKKISDIGRSLLHFALGKIFDDLADYEIAIRHFDEANRLESGKHRFDGTHFTAVIDWLIASFPAHALKTPAASESQLPILIVGMPRSGTTLVEQILASHPQVAPGGEFNFWFWRSDKIRDRLIRQFDEKTERETIGDYLDLLSAVSPHTKRVTDKMPNNFLLLGLVHRLFPKARIIHCRRNSLDTALSIYFSRFTGAQEFAYNRDDIVLYYQEYRRLMDHWRAILPPDRLVEIDYERLVADPYHVGRQIMAFCDLEWDDACLEFHKTDRPVKTLSAWQVRQPLYCTSVERWRHYEPWLGRFRQLPL